MEEILTKARDKYTLVMMSSKAARELIQEDVARYVKEPSATNRVQLRNALMPYASDPYINEMFNVLYADNSRRANELTEKAEDGAISVFGKNLEQLLMQPPVAGKRVLGWDPAFRTGCKLSVVDETGKVLKTTVIFPTAPQNRVDESKMVVKKLIGKGKLFKERDNCIG